MWRICAAWPPHGSIVNRMTNKESTIVVQHKGTIFQFSDSFIGESFQTHADLNDTFTNNFVVAETDSLD
jgi:hypothetical protein